MPNSEQIIINKAYFDNIKTAIDSINSFVESGFKNKNFPIVDADYQLDGTIMTILSWLNNVEPTWIDDPAKVESAVESILDATEDMEGDIYTQLTNDNNTAVLDRINAFIGFKALQMIADHFNEFSELVNGIYTFEIFTNPTKYKNAIDTFSQEIPLSEIEDIIGDSRYTLFDETKYVTGIFNNEQIKLPKNLKLDSEITRFTNLSDLSGFEIVVDDSVQEAAEVNMFSDVKPTHIKYSTSGKFIISNQFEKAVDKLIKGLESCDSTDELIKLFNKVNGIPEANHFTSVVIPYILAKVYSNPNKCSNENYDKDKMGKYTKSYDSIINKNLGAKRFKNYDLFSTFKADKEGTIKFIEDFLKLNLVNDKQCVIKNNTLLTLFNIFDSRIYLDILYNMIPNDVKKSKYPSEDGFVKTIRARINKNSRIVNVYKNDNIPADGDKTPTSKKMMECVTNIFDEFGDMSITDMQYCEQYSAMMMAEIQCVPDAMYNTGTSQIAIDQYIGESYNIFNEGFFSDLFGKKKSKPSTEEEYIHILEEWHGYKIPTEVIDFIKKYHDKLIEYNDGTTSGQLTDIWDFESLYMYNDPRGVRSIKGLLQISRIGLYESCENTCPLYDHIDSEDCGLICVDLSNSKVYLTGPHHFGKCEKLELAKSFKGFMSKLDIPDTVQEAYVLEQEQGDIPNYMKDRINLSDENDDKPNTTITDVNLPPDTPANSVDELADSINARMSADGGLDDVLGAGYNNNPNKNNQDGKIVYNITYNNSFNKNSNNTNTNSHNDSSTGKTITTTNTNTVSNSNNDSSQNKSIRNSNGRNHPNNNIPNNKASNNNNNSRNPSDTKDTNDDVMLNEGYQMFSSGYTIDDVFTFLESEEPQSGGKNAGKPPSDLLTDAIDRDREKLVKHQKAKQKVQKGINLGKALLKPAARTKKWLTDMVNTLVKNDEDRVKAEIIENPSYRTALYKAMRLGLKLGLTTVCFTINAYLGAAYLVIQGSKIADRERLKKEVHSEFMTEIKILDDKIQRASEDDTPESRKVVWKLMRLKEKMMNIVTDTTKTTFKHPKNV
ncbi:MAG: SMI1/KNR4 family protein [Clostridia bacterium]|nr:SMI1/KNR4 family protein [Clostridia bacterium]